MWKNYFNWTDTNVKIIIKYYRNHYQLTITPLITKIVFWFRGDRLNLNQNKKNGVQYACMKDKFVFKSYTLTPKINYVALHVLIRASKWKMVTCQSTPFTFYTLLPVLVVVWCDDDDDGRSSWANRPDLELLPVCQNPW